MGIIQQKLKLNVSKENEQYLSHQNRISEDLDFLLKKYIIDKNKYIIPVNNSEIYNPNDLINNDNIFDLICPICLNIIKNQISCSSNTNSHSFCKQCIDIYLEEHNNCPICKNNFEYKTNEETEKKLNKLLFRCQYFKEGCQKVINYSEYFNHINECEFKKDNTLYECLVNKYNYTNKTFEPCHYIGKKKEIEDHFKTCAFLQYKCIFCNEDILSINFIDHALNKCKVKIYNDNEGDIYIGEIKKNQKNGYGIDYENGNIYKGEWKKGKRNGYGIFNFSNGEKYEGEWKNGKIDGYGVFDFLNGDKYEGEWKDDKMNGYGIFSFSNGEKYDGIWKNNKMNGYGKIYQADGSIYEGEWVNNKLEGYGIVYDLNKKYEALFQNGRIMKYIN